jgi:hypothetical protein
MCVCVRERERCECVRERLCVRDGVCEREGVCVREGESARAHTHTQEPGPLSSSQPQDGNWPRLPPKKKFSNVSAKTKSQCPSAFTM